MISVPLWQTAEHACSYLDGMQSRSLVVDPDFPLDTRLYSQLIEQGFRRSGDQVYKPRCRNCQACVPTRIEVDKFQVNRSQKRCIKRNILTEVAIKPAEFDRRHFELYLRYQAVRHDKDRTDGTSPNEYMQFLGSHWCNTWFVEFSIGGKLAAVAVVDVLDDALSAVYTFFEPEFADYSLGVFAVLWQIEQAGQLNLDYVYLGFWIKDCRKMRYKNQYQPLFGLFDRHWQPISNQPIK